MADETEVWVEPRGPVDVTVEVPAVALDTRAETTEVAVEVQPQGAVDVAVDEPTVLIVTASPLGAGSAPGPQGPAGPAGPPGPAGPTGPAGARGADGAPGAPGASGPAGDVGAVGPAGPAGIAGTQGPKGDTGAAGPAGAAGTTGPPGTTGAQGPAGAAGTAGALGPVGPVGPAGSAGPQGDPGVAGPQGVPGVPGGSVIYSGRGLPPANTGKEGDYWLDTNTSILYGPKTSQVDSALNLYPNPSVETTVGNWGVSVPASTIGPAAIAGRSNAWSAAGQWSYEYRCGRAAATTLTINMQSTATNVAGNATRMPVTGGAAYSFKLAHKLLRLDPQSTTTGLQMQVTWHTATGSQSTNNLTAPMQPLPGDLVYPAFVGLVAPADAVCCGVNLRALVANNGYWEGYTDAIIGVAGSAFPVEWPTTGLQL